MNTPPAVNPVTDPAVTRWLAIANESGEPAIAAEAQQIALRILRRIHFLRRATSGSQEWVEAEIDVLRRRLAVLASSVRTTEVAA